MKRAIFWNLPATRRTGVAGFLLGNYIRNKTLYFIVSYIFFHLCQASFAYGLEASSNSFRMGSIAFMAGGGFASSANYSAYYSAGETTGFTGTFSSRNFSSVAGEAFLLLPGAAPVTKKPISDLKALTEILGLPILESTWQKDDDPYFYWVINVDPPENIEGVAVSLDAKPAQEISTASTFYQFSEHSIPSGKHIFYVLPYVRNKGWDEANMLQFSLWVDVEPPFVINFKPVAGQIVADDRIPVSCLIYDAHSGLDLNLTTLSLNNSIVLFSYSEEEQVLQYTPSMPLPEGKNTVLLKAYDFVNNYFVKGWDFVVDVRGPTGSITINNGDEFTHSAYVSINIDAQDAVSGLKNIYLSNDGVFDAEFAKPYPYSPEISNWLLAEPDIEGLKSVYAKFEDTAGNFSETFKAQINLKLLTPETRIISGPENVTEITGAHFNFEATKDGCRFSYKLDGAHWSEWSASDSADFTGLIKGNHHFYVKSAYDLNGDDNITVDEEDATPAQWAWTVTSPEQMEKLRKRILFWRR